MFYRRQWFMVISLWMLTLDNEIAFSSARVTIRNCKKMLLRKVVFDSCELLCRVSNSVACVSIKISRPFQLGSFMLLCVATCFTLRLRPITNQFDHWHHKKMFILNRKSGTRLHIVMRIGCRGSRALSYSLQTLQQCLSLVELIKSALALTIDYFSSVINS